MMFKELTDEQWRFIRPLLPPPAKTGRPRADDRRTIHAIIYVLTTGCRWMDLPRRYGSDSTANDRLRDWARNGVWKSILGSIVEHGSASGRLKTEMDKLSIDSGDVAAKKGGEPIGYDGHKKVKGSKIHAAVTSKALPVSVEVGEANEHDSRKLIPLLEGISIKSGGRPRKRPKDLYADSVYDTVIVRAYLKRRHVRAQIPRRSRKPRSGRPTSFDETSYKKHRSSVERFFSMLKGGFRRLATRYERLASSFLGLIQIACFIIHWRVFG